MRLRLALNVRDFLDTANIRIFQIMRQQIRLQRIMQTLHSGIYASKMCNPETFYPLIVNEFERQMSCYQVCIWILHKIAQ
jgi:hypothetical protein